MKNAIAAEPYRSSRFRVFKFFDQGRDNFEEIAYDPIVCDFENRRILIFIDRDDCPRPFHSYDMLDGSADSKREV